MQEAGKLAAFSRQPSAHGHYIFFYDNSAYKFSVLFDFLRAGLKRGQTCIYHNVSENRRRLLTRMRKFGLPYDPLKSRLLIRDGPSASSLVDASFETTESEKGGRGLRVVCNAQERLHRQNKPGELVEQEQILHDLASNHRISILCGYDSRWFNRPSWFRVFPPIIRLHSQAAFASGKGTVVMNDLNSMEAGATLRYSMENDAGS